MKQNIEFRIDAKDGSFSGFEVTGIIHQERTEFQQVDIVDSRAWGRILLLNGEVQFSGVDECFSNEMRIHVPVYSLPRRPKRALLIAGASGTCLRELVKHRSLEEIVVSDIDARLIEICREHLGELNHHGKVFDDPRVRIVTKNAAQYVEECASQGKQFDVIIRGTTVNARSSSHVQPIAAPGFYQAIRKILPEDGIFLGSSGIASPEVQTIRTTVSDLRQQFSQVGFYLSHTPSFGPGFWTYAWASQKVAVDQVPLEELRSRFANHPVPVKIYNPDYHWAAFRLDNWHRSML